METIILIVAIVLIAFSLLIVVLVIKPSGIMGKITEDKA